MAANDTCNGIRALAQWITTPHLPELTPERQAVLDAVALLDLGREALNFEDPIAVQHSKRLAYMARTDPTVHAVVLGGEGPPPSDQYPDPTP